MIRSQNAEGLHRLLTDGEDEDVVITRGYRRDLEPTEMIGMVDINTVECTSPSSAREDTAQSPGGRFPAPSPQRNTKHASFGDF